MASADGRIDLIEKKFINDVAGQLGMSAEDLDEITAYPDKYEIKPPPPEQERMTIFYYILFMMAVDGKIHEKEEQMCYKTGLRLGFNEQMCRDLIDVMKKFLNKEIPSDALLNAIKRYMN